MDNSFQNEIRARFSENLIHMGYVDSKQEYQGLLSRSHILPVTSSHDFFGISVLEAMAHDVIPVLPNSMVYPGYIPAQYHEDLLYTEFSELVQKVTAIIENRKDFEQLKPSSWTKSYNWSNIISKYDDLFNYYN